MAFEAGRDKTGGREKGTPNQLTQQMRDIMANIHNKFLGQLESDLMMMSPKNRWDVLSKLAPYHMPTLSRNDNVNHTDGAVRITVAYADPIPTTQGELVHDKPGELTEPITPISLANPAMDWAEIPQKQGAL